MEASPARGAHITAAGVILGVLGAVWAAIGGVLLIVAWLYRNPAALPGWVAADPLLPGSGGGVAVVGVLATGIGLGQVAAGIASQRGAGPWAVALGLVLASVGAGVAAVWLVSGLVQARPVLVLLPVLAAYVYATWVLAFRADWSSRR